MRAAVTVNSRHNTSLIIALWALGLLVAAGLGLEASPAYAKCAYQAFWTWPPASASLPPNGVILLTGYGVDQATVEGIATLKPSLTSDSGDVMPLVVVETRQGKANVSKALLRAKGPIPSATYHLTFEVAPPDHWATTLAEAKWTVSGPADTTPPAWSAPPTSAGGERVEFGCGPDISANLISPVTDAGADDPTRPMLLDITLTDPKGDTERMWVAVGATGGLASIGHGMCSGDFSMSAPSYTATITALDLAANPSPAPGGPLTIITPTNALMP
jgi:hypothetical protein